MQLGVEGCFSSSGSSFFPSPLWGLVIRFSLLQASIILIKFPSSAQEAPIVGTVGPLLFQAECVFWPAAEGLCMGGVWVCAWNPLGGLPALSGLILSGGGGGSGYLSCCSGSPGPWGVWNQTQKALLGPGSVVPLPCFKSHFSFRLRLLIFSPESCCWVTDHWDPMAWGSCPKIPKVVLQSFS